MHINGMILYKKEIILNMISYNLNKNLNFIVMIIKMDNNYNFILNKFNNLTIYKILIKL